MAWCELRCKMSPPQISNESSTIFPEALEQSNFSPFGSVIEPPLSSSINAFPNDKPVSYLSPEGIQSTPVVANQSTALKFSPIAITHNNYSEAPSRHAGTPLQSLFTCFPRLLREEKYFEVQLLERHPYTTQTFAPLGLSQDPDTFYLVVVAPSLESSIVAKSKEGGLLHIRRPPNLKELRAFMAHGGQAVVYGEGTWHAPMIVLGSKRVDFLVTQFVSGVADEDCQEILLGSSISVPIHQPSLSSIRRVKSSL